MPVVGIWEDKKLLLFYRFMAKLIDRNRNIIFFERKTNKNFPYC